MSRATTAVIAAAAPATGMRYFFSLVIRDSGEGTASPIVIMELSETAELPCSKFAS